MMRVLLLVWVKRHTYMEYLLYISWVGVFLNVLHSSTLVFSATGCSTSSCFDIEHVCLFVVLLSLCHRYARGVYVRSVLRETLKPLLRKKTPAAYVRCCTANISTHVYFYLKYLCVLLPCARCWTHPVEFDIHLCRVCHVWSTRIFLQPFVSHEASPQPLTGKSVLPVCVTFREYHTWSIFCKSALYEIKKSFSWQIIKSFWVYYT